MTESKREKDLDAELKDTLRAVLYHFGPGGASKVCQEVLGMRAARSLTHPEAQGNKDLGEPAASGLEEEAQLAAVKFANMILNAYWPDCNDIDGADIQALGIKSGVMQEVPGGYDPEKHGESIYDAEPGDTWYVAHPGLELLPQARSAAPTSPQPIKVESELESASNGMGLR